MGRLQSVHMLVRLYMFIHTSRFILCRCVCIHTHTRVFAYSLKGHQGASHTQTLKEGDFKAPLCCTELQFPPASLPRPSPRVITSRVLAQFLITVFLSAHRSSNIFKRSILYAKPGRELGENALLDVPLKVSWSG